MGISQRTLWGYHRGHCGDITEDIVGISQRTLWGYHRGHCGDITEDIVGISQRTLWGYHGGHCGDITEDIVGISRRTLWGHALDLSLSWSFIFGFDDTHSNQRIATNTLNNYQQLIVQLTTNLNDLVLLSIDHARVARRH